MKISLLIVVVSVFLLPVRIDKKTTKQVNKEIENVFKTTNFSLEKYSCLIPKDIDGEFFIIKSNKTIGYIYIGNVLENSKYFILFNKNKQIEKVSLYDYQDEYGREMCNKAWLQQFVGHRGNKNLKMGKDIDAISGATITSEELIDDINIVCETINN